MFRDKRFQQYSLRNVPKDVLSGLIVGVIAIPLGMAFAMLQGLSRNMESTQQLLPESSSPYLEGRSIKLADQQGRSFQSCLESL